MNNRNGFTTIEVLIAMAILAITLLGAQVMFTDHFIRSTGKHDQRTVALQLAKDRTELIQMSGANSVMSYDQLASVYSETTNTEMPDHPGFTRTTRIVSSDSLAGGGIVGDFTRITVTVDGPGLRSPVAQTVSVGAP